MRARHPATAMLLLVMSPLLHGSSQSRCPPDPHTLGTLQGHQTLLRSQLQFSSALIRALNSSKNVFMSPASVFHALLLAYFASAGHTETDLMATLRFPKGQNKYDILGAYKWEMYYQAQRSAKADQKYQLSLANRLYVSHQQRVRPCMQQAFPEEVVPADFGGNVSATVAAINSWVSSKTRGKITNLLAPDSLNSNTNLVLVNAAYFRGLWKNQFPPSETREGVFTLANGTTVLTMLMNVENSFSHRVDEMLAAEVLELPYEGGDVCLYILLPLEPSVSAISDLLLRVTPEALRDVVGKAPSSVQMVSVTIPKFTIEQSLELTQVLESLKVGDLFRPTADLSDLTGFRGLNVDTAVHRASLTVDEVGSEAAAATAIFANRFAGDSFTANHPFLYFLYDKSSNILLFFGIFQSP